MNRSISVTTCRPKPWLMSHPERGAALIMVLTSLLALSVVVFSVSEKISRQSRDASLLLQEYRSSLPAQAGLGIGLDFLMTMPEDTHDQTPATQGPAWQERNLSISIIPCTARINLGHLGGKGPDRERVHNALIELFNQAGLPHDAVSFLLHWTGNLDPQESSSSHNEILDYYALNSLEYSAPGRELTRPEELMLIPGFEEVSPDWIRKHFSVWGDKSAIDLNHVHRQVALALLPELEPYWYRLESFRQNRIITHPNQLLTEMGLDIATYSKILPHVTLDPELFEIIIEVREGSWYEKHRYIVQKNIIDPRQIPRVLVRDILETKPL